MKSAGTRKGLLSYGALFIFAVLLAATASPRMPQAAQQAVASRRVFALEPSESKVHWVLDTTLHTVHGTFALKRGELHLDPATSRAGGEIIVDAASGQSGNDSRDKKMHGEVLESKRFAEITFRPDRFEGNIPAQGAADVKIHGIISLHGSDHEVTLPVHADITGTHWQGNGKFTVPYIQWGLKNPSNFLLKVKPDVEIELEMSGSLRDASNK